MADERSVGQAVAPGPAEPGQVQVQAAARPVAAGAEGGDWVAGEAVAGEAVAGEAVAGEAVAG
ncbi:MAG: hypothetical protein ACRDY0_11250, partial [Acidimicrobiales bacterium]